MTRLYSLLLLLYPVAFRREYGPAMRQLFGDQWREAPTARARLALLARTLLDVLRSAPRQHRAAFLAHLPARLDEPQRLPITLIAVALLPSLYVVATFIGSGRLTPWLTVVLVAALAVPLVVYVLSVRRGSGPMPGWALFSAGMLAVLGMFGLVTLLRSVGFVLIVGFGVLFVVHHVRRHRVSPRVLVVFAVLPLAALLETLSGPVGFASNLMSLFFLSGIYLPLIALGLLFAPRHGSAAILPPLAGMVLYASIDLDYFLYVLIENEAFIHAFELSWAVGAFLVLPLAVYLARTERARTLAALLPLAAVGMWQAAVHGISRASSYAYSGEFPVVGYTVSWAVLPVVLVTFALMLYRAPRKEESVIPGA